MPAPLLRPQTRSDSSPAEHVTLLRPEADQSSGRSASSPFPSDLLRQSAERLRVLALLYAFVFFMAGVFPQLLSREARLGLVENFGSWGSSAISIAAALLVAAVARSPRVPLPTVMTIGLAFEVLGSYGIAAAEFADPETLNQTGGFFGLSWVAVWTLLFTVVVPTRPRRALLAALASVSSVPVVVGLELWTGYTQGRATPTTFFIALVLPYLLVVVMAYVGARVIYSIGREVSRARELGSYRLEEKLGQGGMGEVWRARHRMLARPAAIKIIRPSLSQNGHGAPSPELLRRFEREAQVIASLRSPHTVELFDFGVATDGTLYYVMELLEGLDTDTLVRRFGPLPAERAVYLLRQVCHSLSEAESRSLVHRDIKPANIFVCRYGEEYDFTKVLDFGLVKAFDEPQDGGTGVTRENVVQGTPAFIAPEQALGRATLDARVDIYTTGCVAYWLLTGQLVFEADTGMGLLMHHVHTQPVPPSRRSEHPIPAALDTVVLSCLAKDPADRPQSARELSLLLSEVEGAGGWSQERARQWWATHRPA